MVLPVANPADVASIDAIIAAAYDTYENRSSDLRAPIPHLPTLAIRFLNSQGALANLTKM